MDAKHISKLATLLRENGDKVLNAQSKLSLSTELLHCLNDAFGLIVDNVEGEGSSFQVIKTNNSNLEFLQDLQFLHDFVQKAVGVKISHSPTNESQKLVVDIRKFKNLKYLEIRKVPVNLVTGLQSVRVQLQSIICIRCLQKLEDFLVNCGADNSSGIIWNELREAVFSYNAIEALDSSLAYAPWLQIMDLSHNRIRTVEGLEYLSHLKYLNMSYNLLECIPVFSQCASSKLQVLVLKNNYIEDVTGLMVLENLSELDLSCNCLTDHNGLFPLLKLSSLMWLSLEGNPVSFHAKHRFCTVQYLHGNAACGKFMLDRIPLSKSERLLISTACCSINQQVRQPHWDSSSHSGSSCTTSTRTQVPEKPEQHTALSIKVHQNRKSKQVREAVISEQDGSATEETDTLTGSLETSVEHLETKRQIETLRECLGEDTWLTQQGGSIVQDVLGLPRTFSTALPEAQNEVHSKELQPLPLNAVKSDLFTSREEDSFGCTKEGSSQVGGTSKETEVQEDKDEEVEEEEEEEADNDEEEEEEAEQQLYTVQRIHPGNNLEELFLGVTEKHLKEREPHSGRTRECWSIDTLQSCVKTCNIPATVQLMFDTVRRNRQEREYVMDEADSQKLVRTLGSILDSRSLSAMNQVPYRCMKCSTQFSQELDSRNLNTVMVPDADGKVLTCPNCGSTMVIEMDEEPLPASKLRNEVFKGELQQPSFVAPVSNSTLTKSPSQSSIGSAASLESQNTSSPAAVKYCDSDIEVISNPSQSSIEVLEGGSRTPGRKHSSEEQQTFEVSQPAHVVSTVTLSGLTESSSSGSYTDSVCTTYEQHVTSTLPSATDEKRCRLPLENGTAHTKDIPTGPLRTQKQLQDTVEEHDLTFSQPKPFCKKHSPVRDFTAIFEGLLQSVSSKLVGTQSSTTGTTQTASSTAVTYSYTDFCRVDHRIKLFLYQDVFEAESEELMLLLRAEVLLQATAHPFPGCLLMSTSRIYILKVNGSEGDDPHQWLSKSMSVALHQLRTVFVLPWNQGVGLELEGASVKSALFLLQDEERTANFLRFLSDSTLPKTCQIIDEPPEYHYSALRQLIASSSSEETDFVVRALAVFNSSAVTGNRVGKLGMGTIIITANDLIMTTDNLLWLFPTSISSHIEFYRKQKMNDLIEMEIDNLTVGLHFLDEAAGSEESWSIVLQTENAVQTVLKAIQVPWEQLFSVPLQLIVKTAGSQS